MSDEDLFSKPVARRTDPDTSHQAARAVTPAADTIRAEVEAFALKAGPDGFIDEELSAAFDAADSSSYRTRRGELTQAGEIVDSRRRRLNSHARQCIVWVHRAHAWAEPSAPKPLTLSEQLVRHANRLEDAAKHFYGQGVIGHAAELRETAALIREALEAGRKRKKSTS